MVGIIEAVKGTNSPDSFPLRQEPNCLMPKHLTVAPPFVPHLSEHPSSLFSHLNANGGVLKEVKTSSFCACLPLRAVVSILFFVWKRNGR